MGIFFLVTAGQSAKLGCRKCYFRIRNVFVYILANNILAKYAKQIK